MSALLICHLCIYFKIGFCIQGWEETVDAALSHLLKTCLSKSSKEQALNLSSQLHLPKDTSRLKKHITLLCERLAKGGRLCLSTDAAAPPTMVMPGKGFVHATQAQLHFPQIKGMCLWLYLGFTFHIKVMIAKKIAFTFPLRYPKVTIWINILGVFAC